MTNNNAVVVATIFAPRLLFYVVGIFGTDTALPRHDKASSTFALPCGADISLKVKGLANKIIFLQMRTPFQAQSKTDLLEIP